MHPDFQEICQEELTHPHVHCPEEQCFEQYVN